GPRIFLVAGEKSGDNLGAALLYAFRAEHPGMEAFGIGGSALAAAGLERLRPMEDLALIGLVEVVGHLPRLRRLLRSLLAEVRRRRPDAAVLIDSPDFNLRLAARLKKLGVPVLYYVSPTVWAWRPGRLRTIRRSVDRMMLIFPFEEAIYAKAGIPARYIGHPLLERVRTEKSRDEVRTRLGIGPERPLIAILPGSRAGEVARHMPVLMKAAVRIQASSNARFALLKADDLDEALLKSFIPPSLAGLDIIDHSPYDVLAASDLALSACGTANLEAALLGVPLVTFYRVSPLTYLFGVKLIRIRLFSIVNILAGERLVPELIQKDFTPERLASEALRLLGSAADRDRMKRRFAEIKTGLGNEPASRNAARELDELIKRAFPNFGKK
ncbi:MAG: lipid-A-disaccharide synthase, partial [Acidobacteriota bacterium]|nr:lipid-A-disaccharide synthase [Acidobacteriota bacterium]